MLAHVAFVHFTPPTPPITIFFENRRGSSTAPRHSDPKILKYGGGKEIIEAQNKIAFFQNLFSKDFSKIIPKFFYHFNFSK